jgi:hypothetical protein
MCHQGAILPTTLIPLSLNILSVMTLALRLGLLLMIIVFSDSFAPSLDSQ